MNKRNEKNDRNNRNNRNNTMDDSNRYERTPFGVIDLKKEQQTFDKINKMFPDFNYMDIVMNANNANNANKTPNVKPVYSIQNTSPSSGFKLHPSAPMETGGKKRVHKRSKKTTHSTKKHKK